MSTSENAHELEQIQIAQWFANPTVPQFDRAATEQAGLDPEFARNFAESFYQRAEELKTTTEPSYKQQAPAARRSSSLLPEWANCAITIAGPAGATVGATAAIFASGGTVALARATYGLSGASAPGSCSDENESPVV